MKKLFCILLAGIFLLSGLVLPLSSSVSGYAETLDEEEFMPEEGLDPEEEAEPAEAAPAAPKPAAAFKKGYVKVTSGTYAYRDVGLTVPAGFFVTSGNVYAQAETDTVLRIVIPNSDQKAVMSVFVALDQVSPMPTGAIVSMRNALSGSNLPTYNGYPLIKIVFKRVEASDEDVRPAPAAQETPAEPAVEPAGEAETAVAEEEAAEEPAAETGEPAPEADWTAAPADISIALSENQQSAVLTWTGNGAAEQYAVFEKMDGYDQLVDVVTGAETYTTGVLSGGEHIFYVIPQNGIALGMASEQAAVLVPTSWQTAVTDVAAALSEDGTKAVLTWTGNGAAAEYCVYEQQTDTNDLLGTVADGSTFTTETLTPGEHTFLIRPYHEDAYGTPSEPVTVAVPMHWKAAPANLTAALSEDGSQVILTWTGNGVAKDYRVYEQLEESNKALGTAADAETFTTKALIPGEHTFFVVPRQDKSNGMASEPVTVTVPLHWKVAPTGLSAELSEDGSQVILTWTGNGIATIYRVYEKLEESNKYVGTAVDAETFSTKALTPGEHTFFVVAHQDKANGLRSEPVTVTMPMHWKVAPTELTAELSEDGTQAVLTWTGNGLSTAYRVYEKLEKSNKALGTVTDAETFTTKALAPGEHTFFVTPRLDNTNGLYSETINVTVPMHWKAAPTDVNAELSEDGTRVTLTWKGNGIATTYRVYEKLADSNKRLGTVTDAETFTTEELEPGEHTFFVLAYMNKANGLYSETVSVLVPEK